MPTVRAFIAAFAIVGFAAPVQTAPAPRTSWGKAGVSLADYRKDAVDCAKLAHYTDISNTEQAQLFIAASKRLEISDNSALPQIGEGDTAQMPQISAGPGGSDVSEIGQDPGTYAVALAGRSERVRASIRPEKLMRELKKAMVRILENCLVERGYSEFSLTKEQRKALRKLKKGSDRRRAYLHQLASDPAILEQQAIVEQ